MNIEVVLTQDDPKLGERGKVVKVSPGFAFNYLFPNKRALLATPQNLKAFILEKERASKKEAGRLQLAQAQARKLERFSLALEVLAGAGDKLYGAVTAQDIQAALARQGIRIDKKTVHLEEPIHQLGDFTVPLKLHPEISVKLQLRVIKKKD